MRIKVNLLVFVLCSVSPSVAQNNNQKQQAQALDDNSFTFT